VALADVSGGVSTALLAPTDIEPGAVAGALASWGGLWLLHACRVVYVLDDIRPVHRVGFAYGTLPGHAERGEERFSIEWHSDDTVFISYRPPAPGG
jgi:uncharacterized protein (UPF0548 family)